jgi:WD40 repeat protein
LSFLFCRKTTDLNDDSTTVPSTVNFRNKRDSTTSHVTHSSQDTHSKRVAGNEIRTDLMRTTTPTTTTRSMPRHQPIIRAAQTRCDADQTVFKIQKGVRTFDLCTAKNVLVTGGMDRVVRLWNPYLPSRPVARLRGHSAPVFLVKISVEDNRLFSISTDKSVLVSVVCSF